MSDSRTMILQMLSEGKITVEESERLLNALNKEDEVRKSNKEEKNNTNQSPNINVFPNIPFLEATKLGMNIRDIAQTLHQTVQQTIKQVEPGRKELKEKMKEFGTWMEDVVETMAAELTNHSNLPVDCMSVDFIVPAPKEIDNINTFVIENIYGEIHLNEGNSFKLLVNGQISKKTIGEMQSSEWFTNKAIRIEEDKMYIGFNNDTSIKGIIDLNINLPAGKKVICKTINSSVRIKGALDIEAIKTISGDIRVNDSNISNTEIESVNGVIQLENDKNINAQINSTSGDIIIRKSGFNKLKINSVNGDVNISESDIALETDVKIITTAGDINVEKLNGPWKSVDATSRKGEIIIDWKGNGSPVNSQKACIKSGGEGAVIYAESLSGNIRFH